MKNRKIMLAPW